MGGVPFGRTPPIDDVIRFVHLLLGTDNFSAWIYGSRKSDIDLLIVSDYLPDTDAVVSEFIDIQFVNTQKYLELKMFRHPIYSEIALKGENIFGDSDIGSQISFVNNTETAHHLIGQALLNLSTAYQFITNCLSAMTKQNPSRWDVVTLGYAISLCGYAKECFHSYENHVFSIEEISNGLTNTHASNLSACRTGKLCMNFSDFSKIASDTMPLVWDVAHQVGFGQHNTAEFTPSPAT